MDGAAAGPQDQEEEGVRLLGHEARGRGTVQSSSRRSRCGQGVRGGGTLRGWSRAGETQGEIVEEKEGRGPCQVCGGGEGERPRHSQAGEVSCNEIALAILLRPGWCTYQALNCLAPGLSELHHNLQINPLEEPYYTL